jgi:hypothetical protein
MHEDVCNDFSGLHGCEISAVVLCDMTVCSVGHWKERLPSTYTLNMPPPVQLGRWRKQVPF